jgi:hypothetical protein
MVNLLAEIQVIFKYLFIVKMRNNKNEQNIQKKKMKINVTRDEFTNGLKKRY